MPCLGCRTTGTNSPTIGICQGCGARGYAVHARIAPRSVRLGSPPGVPGGAGACRALRPACAAAEAPGAAVPTP